MRMHGRVFRWGLLGSTAVALLVGGVSGGPRRKVHVTSSRYPG